MPDLPGKLGIKPGVSVCLMRSPRGFAKRLKQESVAGARFSTGHGARRMDIIIVWPRRLGELQDLFAKLIRNVEPNGAIWAVIPKKRSKLSCKVDFNWEEMQRAALTTDLVDNKTASISEDEYATRFVIRKEKRAKYKQV